MNDPAVLTLYDMNIAAISIFDMIRKRMHEVLDTHMKALLNMRGLLVYLMLFPVIPFVSIVIIRFVVTRKKSRPPLKGASIDSSGCNKVGDDRRCDVNAVASFNSKSP